MRGELPGCHSSLREHSHRMSTLSPLQGEAPQHTVVSESAGERLDRHRCRRLCNREIENRPSQQQRSSTRRIVHDGHVVARTAHGAIHICPIEDDPHNKALRPPQTLDLGFQDGHRACGSYRGSTITSLRFATRPDSGCIPPAGRPVPTILGLVAAGTRIAVVPGALRHLRLPGLVDVRRDVPEVGSRIAIVYRPDRARTPPVSTLIALSTSGLMSGTPENCDETTTT